MKKNGIVSTPLTNKNVDAVEYELTEELYKDLVTASPKYTPDELVKAAATWVVKGGSLATSKLTGIPAPTIRMWTQKVWFKELTRVIRKKEQEELDALYTHIIHRSAEEVQDRIDNGDYILDRQGNLKRVPVKATELSKINGITYDKRALKRGDPTSKIAKETSVGESLAELAKAFTEIAHQQERKEKTIEAEVITEA